MCPCSFSFRSEIMGRRRVAGADRSICLAWCEGVAKSDGGCWLFIILLFVLIGCCEEAV
jgi:hypothetical protein